VAVLFLDLDRFKQINDTLGHDVGDALLIEVAARLARQCRQYDTVARLGGDEFVFVLEDINRPEDALAIADKILESFAEPIVAAGHELRVSTSIGMALFPGDAADIDGVIKYADMALYAAKESGRNTVQLYRKDLGRIGKRPQLQAQDFHEAQAQGQFLLAFQPQFESRSGRLAGVETLLRWRHPRMGLLPPEEFIAEAAECGQLGAVGDWILAQVCAAVRTWRTRRLTPLPITIHVASRQLLDADFLVRMRQAVAAHGVETALFVFELRERALVEAAGSLWESMLQIGRLGFSVAVNDAGSGCGCLPRLAQLPLHRLTLGRPLISALPHDLAATRVAAGLIELGRTLGAAVLAPGVEQEAQLEWLREHGCGFVQGPLLSAALALEEYTALLAASQKCG
jgi:diguanylate cyclase (GGDEF)-like protein